MHQNDFVLNALITAIRDNQDSTNTECLLELQTQFLLFWNSCNSTYLQKVLLAHRNDFLALGKRCIDVAGLEATKANIHQFYIQPR